MNFTVGFHILQRLSPLPSLLEQGHASATSTSSSLIPALLLFTLSALFVCLRHYPFCDIQAHVYPVRIQTSLKLQIKFCICGPVFEGNGIPQSSFFNSITSFLNLELHGGFCKHWVLDFDRRGLLLWMYSYLLIFLSCSLLMLAGFRYLRRS
jgi:hypothetical protein